MKNLTKILEAKKLNDAQCEKYILELYLYQLYLQQLIDFVIDNTTDKGKLTKYRKHKEYIFTPVINNITYNRGKRLWKVAYFIINSVHHELIQEFENNTMFNLPTL